MQHGICTRLRFALIGGLNLARPALAADVAPADLDESASRAVASIPKTSLPSTEVVVTGQRAMDAGTLVRLVRRKQLDQYGPVHLSAALERLPALSTGGDRRGERILSLRGFDQRQIALYVDGIPIAIPFDGQIDLSRIPTAIVDRVAIVNGASNLLYGPNGLGGAIDVTTRSETPSFAALGVEGATGRAVRAHAAAATSLGRLGAVAGVTGENTRYWRLPSSYRPTYHEDGGRRDNSDRRSVTTWSKWGLRLDEHHELTTHVMHTEGRYGVPPATIDLAPRYWRWTDWRLSTIALGHAYRDAHFTIDEKLYVMTAGNTLDSYDNGRYATQVTARGFHSLYDEGSLGSVVRAALHTNIESVPFALRSWWGLRRDTHAGQADRNADALHASTVMGTGALQAEARMHPTLLTSLGVQGDAEFPGEAPSGPRPERATALGPMGSPAYSPTPNGPLVFTLSTARRTRFPTLRERFSSAFATRNPNPSLRPESAWHLSLDTALHLGAHGRIAAGLFGSWLRDLVTEQYVAPGVTQLQNVGRARYLGAELQASLHPLPVLELGGGLVWLDARRTDATLATDHLAYRPALKALASATVRPVAKLAITAIGRAIGAQHYQSTRGGDWESLAPYYLLDGRIDYAAHCNLNLYLRGTNLTGAVAYAREGFPEPGRELFLGAVAHFDGGAP